MQFTCHVCVSFDVYLGTNTTMKTLALTRLLPKCRNPAQRFVGRRQRHFARHVLGHILFFIQRPNRRGYSYASLWRLSSWCNIGYLLNDSGTVAELNAYPSTMQRTDCSSVSIADDDGSDRLISANHFTTLVLETQAKTDHGHKITLRTDGTVV